MRDTNPTRLYCYIYIYTIYTHDLKFLDTNRYIPRRPLYMTMHMPAHTPVKNCKEIPYHVSYHVQSCLPTSLPPSLLFLLLVPLLLDIVFPYNRQEHLI